MKDIKQRLNLGRAGERVQEKEDEVIRMLDKLIEEEEKKAVPAVVESAFAGGGQSSTPLPRRVIPAGVEKVLERSKNAILVNRLNWGDLPPKEREEAMQQIGRDFPAHYREVIEEYFRELAKEQEVALRCYKCFHDCIFGRTSCSCVVCRSPNAQCAQSMDGVDRRWQLWFRFRMEPLPLQTEEGLQ